MLPRLPLLPWSIGLESVVFDCWILNMSPTIFERLERSKFRVRSILVCCGKHLRWIASLCEENSGLRTQNSGLRTQNSGSELRLRTQDSGLKNSLRARFGVTKIR